MSDIKTGDDVVYQDDNGQSRLAKVTAEVGDVSLSAFLDDEGVVTAYEACHVDSDEEPVRVEADEPTRDLDHLSVAKALLMLLAARG